MDTRFATIPGICKVAPEPTRIPAPAPSMALLYESMDDTSLYAQTMRRPIPADPDDVFSECDAEVTDAEHLEDVRHDMRVCWNEALASLGGLNQPKLPTVVAGKLVMLTFPEVLALCGETNHLYVLLANVLRGASADVLHLHLRTTWIDGFCQELADMGWRQ